LFFHIHAYDASTGASSWRFINEKGIMRKLTRIVAGTLCLASIPLAGCEMPDGSCCIWWTLGWMAVTLVTGLYLTKTERKPK
jgi:hypothetical protein